MPQHSSHIEMVFSGHKCQKAKLVLSPAEATMTDIQTAVGASLFREGGQFCPHQSNWDRRQGKEHLGQSLFTTGREKTQARGNETQVRDIRTIRKMGNHMQKKMNQTN